jgi:hypothetical protein
VHGRQDAAAQTGICPLFPEHIIKKKKQTIKGTENNYYSILSTVQQSAEIVLHSLEEKTLRGYRVVAAPCKAQPVSTAQHASTWCNNPYGLSEEPTPPA